MGVVTETTKDRLLELESQKKELEFQLAAEKIKRPTLTKEQELYDKLYKSYDSLEYTEKIMLAQHLGFCPECFSTHYVDKNDLDENGEPKEKPIKPLPYTDISTDHGFSDADTAKRACKKALNTIKAAVK